MDPKSVRKQKSGDQLAVGDWLAPGQISDFAAEVLYAITYPGQNGTRVQLVLRNMGRAVPFPDVAGGNHLFDLASDEDLAEYREAADRAEKMADLRAFVDFLDRNPWAPVPSLNFHAYIDGRPLDDHGPEGLAELRRVADALGEKLDEHLDDRTVVTRQFGRVAYEVFAWHKDGRPAEPKPEATERPECSPACRDLYRPDRGVHFLGCPNFSTPMEIAQPDEDLGESFDRSQTADADETPPPVVGRRREPHTGAVTDEGLVDETDEAMHFQPTGDADMACGIQEVSDSWGRATRNPANVTCGPCRAVLDRGGPLVEHRHVGGSVGVPGENGADCVCGTSFDGFDTHEEATRMLDLHIQAATSPAGLTVAADALRGVLAGTTPVVTYFSFGHGQTDPDTGKSLLNHYVTVVAPTYEACREAMFASRFGREWSFEYLAGTAKATEWIPRWTEHEVIVAPDVDERDAERALTAAKMLLVA